MNVHEYLKLVADVKPSDIPEDDGLVYISKFDGSYITRVGLEDDLKFWTDHDITEQLTHGVGFSPSEKKWYGWSHRAIYGFGIGSTCEKGDCHYKPTNMDELKETAIAFWSDEFRDNTRIEAEVVKDDESYLDVKWDYNDTVPNKERRGTVGGSLHHYDAKSFGKGEWTALTLEDAKQMAVEFNKSVS